MNKSYLSSIKNTLLSSKPSIAIRLLLMVLSIFILPMVCFGQTQTFNSSGTFVVPAGVTSITVQVWGAGGAGGGSTSDGNSGAGGGSGGYSYGTLAVTPGTSIPYIVGTGGAGSTGNGTSGGNSSFLTLTANGGNGGRANGGSVGAGGSASGGSTNTTGGSGNLGGNDVGGKGGDAPAGGGTGGNGSTDNNGLTGNSSGGGGGGGEADRYWYWYKYETDSYAGGNGGKGRIIITYTPAYQAQIISANTGSASWCAGETRTVSVTIKNTGTQPWTDGGGKDFNIGVKWNTNGTSWNDYNVRVDAENLAPGATKIYNLSITASNNIVATGYTTPLAAGTNNISFDVVYEAVAWFGNNNVAVGVGPGNAVFTTTTQTINASSAIVLTGGTQNPTVCPGGAITNTVYTFSGSATNASVTGLPAGLSSAINTVAKTVTISGTPAASGTYIITTTGHTASCLAATINGTITVSVPAGNQTSYGNGSWIGYVYASTNGGDPPSNAFTTNYVGYITQLETFDYNLGAGSISGTNLCNAYADNFAVRYKMNKNLPAGNYTFNVGGDDGYRLYINGTLTAINNWDNHAYEYTTQTVYLSGNTDFILEYFETGGDSRVQFSYTFCPTYALTAAASATSICGSGASTVTLTSSTLPDGTYTVNYSTTNPNSSGNTAVMTFSGTTGTFNTKTISATSTITVGAISSGTTPSICSSAITGFNTATVTVTSSVAADPGTVTGPIKPCALGSGTSYTYSIAAVAGATSYTWTTTGTGWTITPALDGLSATITFAIGATQANLVVKSFNGCGTKGGQGTLNIIPIQTPTAATISGTTSVCQNGTSPNITITNPQNFAIRVNYTINGVAQTQVYISANSSINYISAPTNTTGTFTYNLVSVLNGDYTLCPTNISGSAVISVTAAPTAPTVSAITHPTCSNVSGSFTISNYNASYVYTITPSTGVIRSGSNVTAPAGNYVISASGCTSSATGNVVINPVVTNTWNGSAWSNGTPNSSNQKIVFSGNYPPAVDLDADIITGCSCMVTGNTNVIIKSGKTLAITNEVTVVGSGSESGTLTFEDTASLVQINNVANLGKITYKRNISSPLTTDYTYWSSPVASQKLDLSPFYRSGMYYSYDDFAIAEDWKEETAETIMQIGKGYIVRGPQTMVPPGIYFATFNGIPNNGPQSITVSGGGKSNLIGNPYPSAIDADAFLTANTAAIDGTLYFWTHNTPIAIGTPDPGTGVWAYSGNDYATYTLSGGVRTLGNLTSAEWVDANKNRIVDTGEWIDKNGNSLLDAVEWIDSNSNKKLETGEWTDINKNNIAETGEWSDLDNDGILDLPAEWSDTNSNGTKDFGEWTDTNNNGVFNTGEWTDINRDKILNLEVEQVSNRPTGKIAAGQSFFTTSTVAGGPVKFTNTMRVDGSGNPLNNSNFYKTKNSKTTETTTIEKHRVWLNLTNKEGAFKQTLVGYISGATNTLDNLYDGESFDGNDFLDFYSINGDKNLTIQGRALPFEENDEVPLGYRIAVEGIFTINIDETDGLLANQEVFLEDKLTNKTVNLKEGNYTFNTVAGTFNDRFVLRYTKKTLSVDETDKEDGILVLYSNNYKTLIIRNNEMSSAVNSVVLFNMTGQNIANWEINDGEQTNIQIPIKNVSSGIYIVKVKTTKGESSKKIIIR